MDSLKNGIVFHSMSQENVSCCGLVTIIEPRHEKTCFMHMRKQSRRSVAQLIRPYFHYTNSTIPLLLKSEISSLKPSSVVVQTVFFCWTFSDTPEDRFS